MPNKECFQPAKLDVDPSILDSNLKIVSDPETDKFESLLSSIAPNRSNKISTLMPEDEYPSTTVVPKPGICIKTKNSNGSKYFINLCKLSEIPPPPPITEDELTKMISEEDYSNLWRVPMSLGAPRKEKDKSGAECTVAEVAVNSKWFDQNMVDSLVFTSFVVTVAMEGLADKYGDESRLDRENWTILKNKKFLGETCPPHRIQIRASSGIEHIRSDSDNEFEKVQEIEDCKIKVFKEEKAKKDLKASNDITPKYEIIRHPFENPSELKVTFWLPGVSQAKDITLDIGEDRILLACSKYRYMFDAFLPFVMDNDSVEASFHCGDQILYVTIPVRN